MWNFISIYFHSGTKPTRPIQPNSDTVTASRSNFTQHCLVQMNIIASPSELEGYTWGMRSIEGCQVVCCISFRNKLLFVQIFHDDYHKKI